VVYAASRSGVLVLATTNDSATSPRPLGTLPRPRTAYQASLDIAARLAAADPGNSSLEHERQLLAHELGQLNRAIDSAVTAARPAAQRGHAPPGRRSRPLIYKEPDSAVLRSGQWVCTGTVFHSRKPSVWHRQRPRHLLCSRSNTDTSAGPAGGPSAHHHLAGMSTSPHTQPRHPGRRRRELA
jgi:hypothetical protein